MCRAVTCKACGRTTWAGCGQHVAQVKRSVPAGQWCTCTPEQKREASGKGFFARLLGR